MLQINKNENGFGRESASVIKGLSVKDRGNWLGRFTIRKYEFGRDVQDPNDPLRHKLDRVLSFSRFDSRVLNMNEEKYIERMVGKYLHDMKDVVAGDNLLLNEGINDLLLTLLAGGAATALNNANAYIGVGDDSTAAAATQTGLQAATNKLYVAMDATFPTYGTSQQIVFRSSFTSGQANYAWAEFTVANGNSDAGKNLNRLVSAQGTKTSGQTWQPTLTVTLS